MATMKGNYQESLIASSCHFFSVLIKHLSVAYSHKRINMVCIHANIWSVNGLSSPCSTY